MNTINVEILSRYPRPWKIRPYDGRANLCAIYDATDNVMIVQWIQEDVAKLIVSVVNDQS